MEQHFLKVAQESHFFDKHTKVLVAVSGGKDSMCLLHLLYQNKEKLEIQIAIAHVNHGQRQQSLQEEQYLQELAKKWNIPFYATHFTGKFSEAAARKFRYDFFEKIMQEEDYTALVTAHHADDQVETLLMRFIRGTRWLHLSGIKAVQPFATGELIRPLLTFHKDELIHYPHFEDVSNQQDLYFRNRVRHHILPMLQEENSAIVDSVLQLGKEMSYLLETVKDLSQQIDIQDIKQFQTFTKETQYILLQLYLENFPDLQVTTQQFEEILHILQSKANYRHHVKNGYYLLKDYTHFEVTKILPKEDGQTETYMLEFGELVSTPRFDICFGVPLEEYDYTVNLRHNLPVVLRPRRLGDKILLNGIQQKLRRYFINHKVPITNRTKAIVIEQGNQIYGVVNLVSSDLSKSLKSDIMKAKLYIKMKE